MVCTCEILVGGGGLFGQVKSVVIKISFSKGGVTSPVNFGGGGLFGQVKYVVIKIARGCNM